MREPVKARPGPKLEEELAGLLDEQAGRQGEPHRGGAPARWPSATPRTWSSLQKKIGRKPMITVPELPGDVHDLDGLRAMNEHLFA